MISYHSSEVKAVEGGAEGEDLYKRFPVFAWTFGVASEQVRAVKFPQNNRGKQRYWALLQTYGVFSFRHFWNERPGHPLSQSGHVKKKSPILINGSGDIPCRIIACNKNSSTLRYKFNHLCSRK